MISKKLLVKLILLNLLILLSNCGTESSNKPDCIDKNCRDYTSRAEAQAAFDADPECRNNLDHDGDRIACEEPGNEVSTGFTGGGGVTCPTTSNCGCSNKTKAECESSPCCKWVVGDGCKCK